MFGWEIECDARAIPREGPDFYLISTNFTKKVNIYVLLTVQHIGIIFVNNQLDAQFFFPVRLFLFSTCFGQACAHHQEN
jgi:hypothetical protein